MTLVVYAWGHCGFGTLNDYEESAQLADLYVNAGGMFIDTGNSYNQWSAHGKGGESEVVVGRWLRERGNRDDLFIASKVGFGYEEVPDGLAASTIISECEKSLKRLGVDYLDLYYGHKDDPRTPLEETLGAFQKLVQAGKVRFVGASNCRAWRLADADAIATAQGWAGYTCIEQRFTYLRPNAGGDFGVQRLINPDLMSYCDARGKTMLPYTPLLRGAYVRPERPIPETYAGPDTEARKAALRQVAQELDATLNQVVLAWMMHRQPPLLPVFSGGRPEHMKENLGALDLALSPEQMATLNNAGHCVNQEPN